MQEVVVNGKWPIFMPSYRAERPEWTTTGWEVERLDSLYMNVGPGDCVYDVGTEEGELTALIASWIGPGDGGVCMFEPNCAVWPNVKAVWEHNQLTQPIYAFHGFASAITTCDLRQFQRGFTWPECVNEPMIRAHGQAELHDVEANEHNHVQIELDDFAAIMIPPSVVNIDVEGSELHVLRGCEMILYDMKPLVYVSIHPGMMNEYGHTEQQLHDYMCNEMKYRAKVLGEDHERHVLFYHPEGREPRF